MQRKGASRETARNAENAERRGFPRRFRQSGGDVRIRTADPLHAKQVLYQLSYTPTRPAQAADRCKYALESADPLA